MNRVYHKKLENESDMKEIEEEDQEKVDNKEEEKSKGKICH